MRISDWSSDVCSSDLFDRHREGQVRRRLPGERELVAATLLDQLRQGGLLEIDVEETAVILARHLLHVRDILLRGAEARLEIARPWIPAAIDFERRHPLESVIADQVPERVEHPRALPVTVLARAALIGFVPFLIV